MKAETIYRVFETDHPVGDGDVEVMLQGGVGRRFVARRVDGDVVGGAHAAQEADGEVVLLVRAFPLAARDTSVWKDAIRGWEEGGGLVVVARAGDASVAWTRGLGLIAGNREGVALALAELVEFAVGEEVLCEIEAEVDRGWGELDCDAELAYRVEGLDRARDAELQKRAMATMRRRLLFMRWEPLWLGTGLRCGERMPRLGEMLREEVDREDRCVTLDGRLESAEYVYELVGQRAGEFRHAREGYWVECVIVFLLAAELIMTLLEYFG